ncbi:MAG: dihydrodipicolinate synthase family protein, partial [Anaerolineae bacterium]|nr:dihydrodipicolinate synthase family protein [Anaerolineae bacterium]
MIYNIPQMAKTIIEPDTVAQLARVPEIIAVKDSWGDMTRFQRLLAIKNARADFGVYQGAEGVAALSIVRGANGAVLGLANVAPKLCCDLYAAARAGDLSRAWALQERLMTLWQLHTHGQWLPCLKMAVSQLGICGATTSAPFAPLDENAIAAIRRDLHAALDLDL